MTETDDHIQHTWHLSTPAGDEMTIDLWTDGYSVRVHGGPDDGHDDEDGMPVIEQELLPKYRAAGRRVDRDYAVNDPAVIEESAVEPEPDGRPDACPECGSPVEHDPTYTHPDTWGTGAWLCTECKWGEWV